MAKKGRPRVAKKHSLSEFFSVRLRPDEAEGVREAICESGKSKPDWLRDAILSKVSRRGKRGGGHG
jgi:hypothetical protein